MHYIIRYFCISHIGKHRRKNQDNYICGQQYKSKCDVGPYDLISGIIETEKPIITGIFDGMGGEQCGETASLIAAQTAFEADLSGNIIDRLNEYCRISNRKICSYADEHGIFSMGTTAAMLVFARKEIGLCNIGDTRIYRYSDDLLEQISVDHYAVSYSGNKPPLSQNLGIPESEFIIDPYVAKGKYNKGDIYLICSDGLTDMVSNKNIERIIKENNFEDTAMKLLQAALDGGGRDNITIIICRVERKNKTLIDRILGKKSTEQEFSYGK